MNLPGVIFDESLDEDDNTDNMNEDTGKEE